MRKLIVLSITVMSIMVSGITQAEDGVVTQQELEQREKDIKSGVGTRGTMQQITGCVTSIMMHIRGNTTPPKFGAHFYAAGTLFGIQYNGIAVGSYVPSSIPFDQMPGYGPLLTELRHAVDKKVKVLIDHKDGFVWYVRVLDTQPCP